MKLKLPDLSQTRILLIAGDEDALRRRAFGEVLTGLGVSADDFDLEAFNADTRPPQDWEAAAGTPPFFSPRRVVIVRQVLRQDPPAKSLAIPETGFLLLVADEESGSEDKQRQFTTRGKAWAKWCKEAGGYTVDCTVDPKLLQNLLRAEAEQMGKKMSVPAAKLLEEMTGANFSRAMGEIEKLSLFLGDRHEIREEDVRKVVFPTRDWSLWSLIDAVIDQKPAVALAELRSLLGTSTKVEEAANRSILPQLSRQVRLVWQARVCLDQGDRAPDVRPSTLALLPEKNISGERGFVITKAFRQAGRLSLAQLTDALQELADADAQLKGALPSAGARETLETLILRLGNVLSGRMAS